MRGQRTWWRNGALAAVMLAAVGCGSARVPIADYAELTGADKAHVDAAIEKFRACALERARLLDRGRRRVNRLAWSATEHCIYSADDIARSLVEVGATLEYGLGFADDQRVAVAAYVMEVLQRNRRAGAQ
ncbi:MAG: hypothetical protein QF926_13430 [Alphaproteobacteria bacterium]|nr:hypothetical protein [Alphaproteobacteria bacterium]MDP6517602.1 hypothetical protein [Alphaproteobacteria bacterium]